MGALPDGLQPPVRSYTPRRPLGPEVIHQVLGISDTTSSHALSLDNQMDIQSRGAVGQAAGRDVVDTGVGNTTDRV